MQDYDSVRCLSNRRIVGGVLFCGCGRELFHVGAPLPLRSPSPGDTARARRAAGVAGSPAVRFVNELAAVAATAKARSAAPAQPDEVRPEA